jgi:hypothetical protein
MLFSLKITFCFDVILCPTLLCKSCRRFVPFLAIALSCLRSFAQPQGSARVPRSAMLSVVKCISILIVIMHIQHSHATKASAVERGVMLTAGQSYYTG